MTTFLPGLSNDSLIQSGARHTAKEIGQQPDIWTEVYNLVKQSQDTLNTFLKPLYSLNNIDVIFTGAGTSAFIGTCLEGMFLRNTGISATAVPTTQIVTHPEFYFSKNRPTLLVSFARSGDSPESMAAVEMADQICNPVYHLIITCNSEGKLAQYAEKCNAQLILLPPETNDQSLAMTSSFTSMLLTGILISKLAKINTHEKNISLLSQYGHRIISDYALNLKEACELPFDRSVFLGSGPMIGTSEECHLKLQELTDGTVMSAFDSFLGFRHGPKAVITDKTLMVYLFSKDKHVLNYERDLLRAVNDGEKGLFRIGSMEEDIPDTELDLKIILASQDQSTFIDPDFLSVCNTLVGQLLGFYKSLQMGLNPDAPSKSGTITRVVQGVRIYPYSKSK